MLATHYKYFQNIFCSLPWHGTRIFSAYLLPSVLARYPNILNTSSAVCAGNHSKYFRASPASALMPHPNILSISSAVCAGTVPEYSKHIFCRLCWQSQQIFSRISCLCSDAAPEYSQYSLFHLLWHREAALSSVSGIFLISPQSCGNYSCSTEPPEA